MNLTIATGNDHKVQELETALAGTDVTLTRKEPSIHEIDAHDVETVAIQKAKDAAENIGADGPVMVDDTGLYVTALEEFPGSHASYFLERCGINGLLTLMDGLEDRSAWFKTTIAIYRPDEGSIETYSGTCDGTISEKPMGTAGFGYDPVFIPDGNEKTFAEDKEYKERVSHRKKAIEELVSALTSTS